MSPAGFFCSFICRGIKVFCSGLIKAEKPPPRVASCNLADDVVETGFQYIPCVSICCDIFALASAVFCSSRVTGVAVIGVPTGVPEGTKLVTGKPSGPVGGGGITLPSGPVGGGGGTPEASGLIAGLPGGRLPCTKLVTGKPSGPVGGGGVVQNLLDASTRLSLLKSSSDLICTLVPILTSSKTVTNLCNSC